MSSKQNMARRVARLRSLQALFQMEATGAGLEKVTIDFASDMVLNDGQSCENLEAADFEYFKLLLNTALSHQKQIDQLTNLALKDGWPIQRIDPTLRALFRAAGAEFMVRTVPPRVTIDEFVEIAKAFYPDGKAAGLANGVLDHMARKLRAESFKN